MSQIYHVISETILDYGNYFLRLCNKMPTRIVAWCVYFLKIISDKNIYFINVMDINSINLDLYFF